MAHFIPDVNADTIEHDSERLVYEALRALSNEYYVMHSYPWLRPNRVLSHEPLREGEADFVIINRTKGILVLEVKGGVPTLKERSWFRGNSPMRDPFEQARRNRYALLDAIEERTQRRLTRKMMVHGDVVVFPHCRYEGPLPLNSDPRIILDSNALSDLAPQIDRAFTAWKRDSDPLNSEQFNGIVEVLMPKLRLLRCVGTEIESENRKIVQVTLDQQATLRGLLENDRVLIEGTAGSGKTLLALEFAKTLALKGEHILFLCFNRHLANWMKEQISLDGSFKKHAHLLEISTFHSFALAIANRAKVEFRVPEEQTQQFWDSEVPLILEQALEILKSSHRPSVYRAVIVDEAQDFSPDWWVTVESLTASGRGGRLYAFLDLNQSLRGDPRPPSVPFNTKFRLLTNCRNTKSIATGAASLAKVKVLILPGSPAGESPSLVRAPTREGAQGILRNEVRSLLKQRIAPTQLALISPASYEGGGLSELRDIDGVPLVTDATAWRRGGGILVTTARAFKGLEADVVIIHDLESFGTLFTKTDLYVAWTRARNRLIVICHGPEVRATVEAALAEAPKYLSSSEEQHG